MQVVVVAVAAAAAALAAQAPTESQLVARLTAQQMAWRRTAAPDPRLRRLHRHRPRPQQPRPLQTMRHQLCAFSVLRDHGRQQPRRPRSGAY